MATIRKNKITPGFRWNETAKRYIGPGSTGFVKNTDVRKAIDKYIDTNAKQVEDLARQLKKREISIAQWQRKMHTTLSNIHMASAAAAKGGWAQMDAKAQGTVAQFIKQELGGKKAWENAEGKKGGLRQFALDIKNGLPLDGRFVNRAKMYAQAGRHTYEETRRSDMMTAGMTEARSIRHSGDSCYGCKTQAAIGWQPILQLVPIGTRDCLRNCKCTVQYRKFNPNSRIDELVKKAQSGEDLNNTELKQLAQAVANSGFPSAPQRVTVDSGLAGVEWNGKKLKLGDRIPSDHWHYLKHVVVQKEWPAGTTYEDYIRQTKEVITDPTSGILISKAGRHTQISFVRKTGKMRGSNGHKWTMVDYRPRVHSVMTSFQPEKGLNHTRRRRKNRKWIREREK